MNYQITTTILGLLLASAILYWVRRDHLHGPYAQWWLVAAAVVVVLGFFPRTIDFVADRLGIGYPPTLLFSVAIGLMLIKMLRTDIECSRHEKKLRRLAQELAMLSEENRQLREHLSEPPPAKRVSNG